MKRWKAFDAEMQKQLDSMAKSRRTVARFTGFAMSEMDGSGSSMSSTQHRDRYEVHFPSSMMKDTDHEAQFPNMRGPGDAPYPILPPKPETPHNACCVAVY